jgi:hypothetical protein
LALNAVIEALGMNPDRYAIICNSKYDDKDNVFGSSTTTSEAVPHTHTSTFTKPQNYYYDKYHEGLVELAKGFLKILSSQLVDKTMVAAVVKADVK